MQRQSETSSRILGSLLLLSFSLFFSIGCDNKVNGGWAQTEPGPSDPSSPDEDIVYDYKLTLNGGFTLNEGSSSVIVLLISKDAEKDVPVFWQIQKKDGSSAAADFDSVNGSTTFAAGTSSATFNVTPADDLVYEQTEEYLIYIVSPLPEVGSSEHGYQFFVEDNDSPPTLQFSSTGSSVTEGPSTPVSLGLESPTASTEDVVVKYAINASSTTDSSDHSLVDGSVTLIAGNTTASIDFELTDDTSAESLENIVVDLVTISGGEGSLGGQNQHTVALKDDDSVTPTLSFDQGSTTLTEETAAITVSLGLSQADSNPITVDYHLNATDSGTASQGTDYNFSSGTFTFASGETSKSFTVGIIEDTDIEDNETIYLKLSNASGNVLLGGIVDYSITVNDDDKPVLQFASVSSSALEDAGSLSFTVNLSAAVGQDVSVPYYITGSAISPDDHDLTNGSLTITAGNTNAPIPITLEDDSTQEDDEFVIINLGTPSNAELGNNSYHILTIKDNDSGPTLYLSGTGGSTLDGVAITSCGGTDACSSSNPYVIDSNAIFGDVIMENGAHITTSAWTSGATPGPGKGVLKFTVNGDMSVCSDCVISTTGKGYTAETGPGAGGSRAGGGYGGAGGDYGSTSGGQAYGDFKNPAELGSGGGYSGGGTGGGLISLTVKGVLTLNGTIASNGNKASHNYGGGGAGGGIRLDVSTISGSTGAIQSKGGRNGYSTWGGGGGGGRIALVFSTDSYSGGASSLNLHARGSDAGSQKGAPGSVYLKNKTTGYETLIIDNENESTSKTYILGSNLTIDQLIVRNQSRLEISPGVTLTVSDTPSFNTGALVNRGTLANPVMNLNFSLDNYGTVTYPNSSLTIVSGGHLTDHVTSAFDFVEIQSGGSQTLATATTYNDLRILSGGTLSHLANADTQVYSASVTVNNNFDLAGLIDISEKGFTAENGPGAGASRAGGGYGGSGGDYDTNAGGSPYGDFKNPAELGSGGGHIGAGAGGGLLSLSVGGTFNFTGSIKANGGKATNNNAGGGSGGGVNIVTNTLAGSGATIAANGGQNGFSDWGGGGGGGRIALTYSNDTYNGGALNVGYSAKGATGWQNGAPGSIYIHDQSGAYETLLVDNGMVSTTNPYKVIADFTINQFIVRNQGLVEVSPGVTVNVTDNLNYNGGKLVNRGTLQNPIENLNFTLENHGSVSYPGSNLTIVNGGHLIDHTNSSFSYVEIQSGGKQTLAVATTYNQLNIQAGGILTHLGNSSTQAYTADVTVTTDFDLAGTVDVSERGYAGQNGPGAGASRAGGGYGGPGGDYDASAGGSPYGDFRSPAELGSGGGYSGGGAGGGLFNVTVGGTFNFTGSIQANGAKGTNNNAGGGSGGGVNIVTSTLTGSGATVAANGGQNGYSNWGGGGGGGRIAVVYTTDTYSGGALSLGLSAYGATGWQNGGPGSIYFKNQSTGYETLIIDNSGIATDNPYPIASNLTIDQLIIRNNGRTDIAPSVSVDITDSSHYNGGYLVNRGTLIDPVVDLDFTLENRGTVTYPNSSLTIVNGGHLIDYMTSSFSFVEIQSGGKQTLALATTYGDLNLLSGGTITHLPNTSTQAYSADMTVNNDFLFAGAIDVSGKGYTAENGPGTGASRAGGGHGGKGGEYSSNPGGSPYGDVRFPATIGSGGGYSGGGAGGGLLDLTVSGTLNFTGSITADGLKGTNNYAGGGAGGGVLITANALSGSSASISAKGGENGYSNWGGCGAGGRVAVYYSDDSGYSGSASALNVDVSGATGCSNSGEDGTYYFTPTLTLDFASGSLPATVTFSRASQATYYNASGQLVTASSNSPRFDHNPATGESLGLLLEESRTNDIQYSEALDNAFWSATDATASVDAITSPDNNVSAEKLVEGSSTSAHEIYYNPTLTPGSQYSFSAYAKVGERSWAALTSTDLAGTTATSYFDLLNGTTGTVDAAHTADIQSIGNGWYRLSITFSANSGASPAKVALGLASADNSSSYAGDNSSGAYFWGVQLEEGEFPTSYIATNGSAVTRASDLAETVDLAWHDSTKGSFLVSASAPVASPGQELFSLTNNAASNFFRLALDSSGLTNYQITNSSTNTVNLTSSAWSDHTNHKVTVRYDSASADVLVDGGSLVSDSTVTLPSSVDRLYLGGGVAGNTQLNGHLKRLEYLPVKLTTNTMKDLSQ